MRTRGSPAATSISLPSVSSRLPSFTQTISKRVVPMDSRMGRVVAKNASIASASS
ncbi:hypothetical protein BCO18175_05602 [Burkholderia contaminans]|nr:hypothetical protein BCO18175_05602 [Burkholderia contaminans]